MPLARRASLAVVTLLALVAGLLVAPLAGGARAASLPWGVDVASYQHPGGAAISWPAVRRSGASFAIIKATEGSTYVNPYFASDWANARAAGLDRGAYAFARPAMPLSTAVTQAQKLVQVAGTTRETGDLPLILDLEVSGGLSPSQLASWTHAWLTTVEALTGRVPVIYTGQYFWRDEVGDASGFTGFPLWLAAYQSVSPRAPYAGGWGAWEMWQYTSGASVAGISGRVDASQFGGSAAQLAAFADGRDTLISRAYARLGGAAGVLGAALGPEVAIAGGGFGQTFAHGALVQVGLAVRAVYGSTGTRYVQLGAWKGALGLPSADTSRGARGDVSRFARGEITALKGHPAYTITGAIWTRYAASGATSGSLGWATGAVAAVGHASALGASGPVTAGLQQTFQNADILSSTKSGTHVVSGPILTLYQSLGGADSALGMPSSDQYAGTLGPQIDFQLGSIVYVTALKKAIAL